MAQHPRPAHRRRPSSQIRGREKGECPRNCVGMIERKRHAFNNQEKSRSSEGLSL
jgi:hypothetical protein